MEEKREFSVAAGLLEAVGRWRRLGINVQDCALGLAFTAVAFVPGLVDNGVQLGELSLRRLDLWGVLLGLGQALPLVTRRSRPMVCLALVAAAFSVDQLLGYSSSFGSEGILIALYTAGAYIERQRWVVASAGSAVYLALAVALDHVGSPERPVEYLTFWLMLAGCWATGCWMRGRRAQEEERHLHRERLAVVEERARIARELHDVVTHHVTAIVVQSDAAQFLLPTAPDRVADGLAAIGSTGRRALAELRYLLDVLDRHDDLTHPEHGPVSKRLADLVQSVQSAGQPVELVEQGEPRALPAPVALSVYRVVQEALTNAVKYAPGRPTVVEVGYDDEGVDIEVTNEGQDMPFAAATSGTTLAAVGVSAIGIPSGGRGLVGLRERIGVLGGQLSAGPCSGGGFRVQSRLPSGSGR